MRWQISTVFIVTCGILWCGPLGCTEEAGTENSPAGDAGVDATADVPDGADGDEDTSGGIIQIYLAGDLSEKTFDDGLSGQTPKEYEIALSKYHVQTSLDDPSPVVCFEHEEPVVADMLQDNWVGSCRTESIPTDTYTHGRTKVDWVRLTVDGTLHHAGQGVDGEFTFFRAYSDTTYEGETYEAGQGWLEFSGASDDRLAIDYGEDVPAAPGFKAETIDGEFWLTFPFNAALPVDQNNPQTYGSRLHWEVYEGFRWQDRSLTNHSQGQWDVHSTDVTQNEQVVSYGVTGYHITAAPE